MQRVLLTGLWLLGLCAAAAAADLPLKAPPAVPDWSWSGFYLGIDGGYSFGRDPFTQNDPSQGLASATASVVTPSGGLFGGQIGYNWQVDHLLLGVEGDAQWADQDGTSCAVTCFVQANGEMTASTVRQRLDWFATARGRLGWANGGYLLYVTGGAAWGGLRENDTINIETLPPFAANFNSTLGGWVAGAGIEARVWGNWTAKLEYLHLDLGNTTNTATLARQSVGAFAAGPFVLTTTSSIRDDIIRAGLNYKFVAFAAPGGNPAVAFALPVKAPAPVWTWTGFYVGINGGYSAGSDPFTQALSAGGVARASTYTNANVASQGGLFGGQAGYNWQNGKFVFGIEGDGQWSGQNGTSCGLVCAPGANANAYTTISQNLDWFATARGRLGWANEGYLFYVTGGGAFGGINETDSLPAVPASASFSHTLSGWTAGGGIEARLWGNWTAKIEYLHVDLGSTTNAFAYAFAAAPFALSTTSAIRDDLVRAGLNYKFGG